MITYEFKIKANNHLKDAIENHLGCTRLVYNLALEVKEYAYKKGVNLSKFDLIKQLPELKQEFEWLYNINAQTLKKYLKELRIENRSLSRKKKFSSNFYKQVERLKKLHLKISRIRKDYLHKTSTKLAQEYSTIVCEDLNIQEMIKERGYSREISDVSWGSFLEMLEYKTNLIRVDPKYTSQECNNCGHTCKENRPTQELFNCVKCGHTGNADYEASLTILKRGQTLLHANVEQ